MREGRRDVPIAPIVSLAFGLRICSLAPVAPMKRLAILMFFAGLVSLPSGAQSEEKASPLMTALSSTTIGGYVSSSVWWRPGTGAIRPSFGSPFNGYLYTGYGWRAHVCWWSYQIPNRNGFHYHGVYGGCQHGIIFLPARPLRAPPGVFPGPFPPLPLPRPTPGTPGTNQIPPRIIRQPPLPVSPVSQLISMEATRMPRSGTPPTLPLPPQSTASP
jgi:hypothetical protein